MVIFFFLSFLLSDYFILEKVIGAYEYILELANQRIIIIGKTSMPPSKASFRRLGDIAQEPTSTFATHLLNSYGNSEKKISLSTIFLIIICIFFGLNLVSQYQVESEEEQLAEVKWKQCLLSYTNNACNVQKDNAEQRKLCQQSLSCLNKGYDKPQTTNIFDAFGDSMKQTSGVAIVLSLLGIFVFK